MERTELDAAITAIHPCEDRTTCDIAVAQEQGFTYVAADLLRGATETPEIDRLIEQEPGAFRHGLDAEWSEWSEFFDTFAVMCDACGGATFRDDLRDAVDTCGHCGAPSTAAIEQLAQDLALNDAQMWANLPPSAQEFYRREAAEEIVPGDWLG